MSPDQPPVPFVDLGRTWAGEREGVLDVFARVAASGRFSLGPELTAFETEFARFCGTEMCVGVASGTAALELALRALGAGPGREVIAPALTFVATVEAIVATGATPVLVDVDPGTRCMCPDAMATVLGERTAAVVPVHLHGRPADLDAITTLCDAAGVPVVEDAAQAHGARIGGRRVGAVGTVGCFSFYPTKNLGAFGDGGAVVTDDAEVAASVRSLRHHGCADDDASVHVRVGRTERLDEIQAAILRLRLRSLDADNARRRRAADRYGTLLSGLPLVLPPADAPDASSVHHVFVVEVDERDRLRSALAADGIATGVHYGTPIHLQPAWRDLADLGTLPIAERLAERVLSLPMFAAIEDSEIERVAAAVRRALR